MADRGGLGLRETEMLESVSLHVHVPGDPAPSDGLPNLKNDLGSHDWLLGCPTSITVRPLAFPSCLD